MRINPFARKKAPSVVQANIDAVASLEHEFRTNRTAVDYAVDVAAGFTGSVGFVVGHIVWFAVWFCLNSKVSPWEHFDPFPCPLLSTIVSAEAVLLSAVVLMKQNRMGKHADERDHLHLQVNLLAEKEITKVLQTLQVMGKHMGIAEIGLDREAQEMSQDTPVHHLAAELREKIHALNDEG